MGFLLYLFCGYMKLRLPLIWLKKL